MVDREDVRQEHGYHALRVKKVVRETADTRSFVLDVPGDLLPVFSYRAGQFCTFRVRLDGTELLRSYSMSSAPETDADLTVTVKGVPGGLVSTWFNDHVAEDDVLEVTKPAGVFCVREGTRPVVAFCGGSGVTPVLSIAKSVLATTHRPVRIFYANRDRHSVIFDEELRGMFARYPGRLEVRHHLDAESGFPDHAAVTGFAAGAPDADFYLCGPGPFMDMVEAALLDAGVDGERILVERFGDTAGRSRPEPPSGKQRPEAVTLIMAGARTTVAYQPGDTVLETARRGGLKPPFSCEAGNCATCMAILREGRAAMLENNALTPEEVAQGWVLTCQAVPEGPDPVTVEYEAL